MSNEDYTVFVRNLPDNITEPLLYELFLQAGPLEDVRIPTVDGKNRNYGFIVYKHKCSVKYAMDLFKDSKIFGKTIALQNRILDAKREEEMRSRMNSWRNDDMNSLRGGPPVFSRFNDTNALRGGPLPNSSRNDMDPLRGGMVGFSRKDNMSPMSSYSNNPYNGSMDPRFMNPYANFMNVYDSQSDNRGSPNYDRYGRSQDRYDRNRDNGRDHSWRDREGRRHDRNSRSDRSDFRNGSRHDRGFRGDRDNQRRDHSANDLRQALHRSRSRDRSPSYRNDRNERNRR